MGDSGTSRQQRTNLKISQHGFMTGRSCLTNLLVFFEEVYDELDGLPYALIC